MPPRTRRHVFQKFSLRMPQGVVIRPENTLVKMGSMCRLLAETGDIIKRVRTEPDLIWEFPVPNGSDRVHVPLVQPASGPNYSLTLRVQSFTQSQEIQITDLKADELECVVCKEKMVDPDHPVYKCRQNRHFVCETCVLNMDATSSSSSSEVSQEKVSTDKCPICRHEDTFFVVQNWAEQLKNLQVQCPLGCEQRFLPDDEEAHFAECTCIVLK